MKELLQISKKNQLATLVLGLVIAMFSVVAPYYYIVAPSESQIAEQINRSTAQGDEKEPAQENPVKETIVKAIDAVPNVLQISFLNLVTFNVPDFVTDSVDFVSEKTTKIVLSTSKHFKTLFRNIISSNAP